MQRSDPELVQACLNGEHEAWDTLVERYGRLVYSIPRRLGLSDSDADDVFQTVMGTVLKRLASLRDQSRLSAWLIRMTYRESWRLANRQRRARGQELEDAADAGTPTDEQVARLERQQLVRQALEEIDDRCGRLIHAFYFDADAPSYEQMAEQMGVPIGSIGPTRARCFKKLERILVRLGM